jgi:hypothetical protein
MSVVARIVVGFAGLVLVAGSGVVAPVQAQEPSPRVFELRTYTAAEGKLQTLSNRFRDRTLSIFKKHGMEVIGFWIPNDPPEARNQLVYVMS